MIYLKKVPQSMKPHVAKVLNGEYDVPLSFKGTPTVLDIGANIGSFTVWAAERWSGKIIAIEPIKENFEMLQINTADLGDRVALMNVAVKADKSNTTMYIGKNNCGECSFSKGKEQTDETEKVEVITVEELPNAEIIKIDTEGCEVEIITEILRLGRRPSVLLLEYHKESDRRVIDDLLGPLYDLWGSESKRPGEGVVKYASKSISYE